MIYLSLFLTFFEIGAVSFGGGYAMISLIRDKVLANGWMTEETLLHMVAVSESTPGPIAVNMATFVGSTQGGFGGALIATLGVVLPSFLIILLIAVCMRNFLQYKGVQAFLGGVRPCIVALILGTAVILFLNTVLGLKAVGEAVSPDFKALLIFALVALLSFAVKRIFHKKISPILLILFAAVLGMVVYSL